MTAGPQTLLLGQRLGVSVTYPSAGAVEATLTYRDRPIVHKSLTAETPRACLAISLGPFRAACTVVLDVFAGEVRLVTELAIRPARPGGNDRKGRWSSLSGRRIGRSRRYAGRHVLFRFAPGVGQVAGSTVVHAPVVNDPVWGTSQLCTPTVLRLFVEDTRRGVAPVGRLVKQVLFPDHPPFVFNTVACVGGVAPGAPGRYSDPLSPWFNVFFGYYQIDCDKRRWSRPFAYREARGAASAVDADDIVRLAAADWNWFSNWVYGIPGDVAMAHSSVRADDVAISPTDLVRIGCRRWHRLRISGMPAASCYQSGVGGDRRLVRNSAVAFVWRRAFGLPHPRPQFPRSFVPTTLESVCEMSYWEDESAFHTVVFGATATVGTDPGFIDAQQEALRQVITHGYPTLGFDPIAG